MKTSYKELNVVESPLAEILDAELMWEHLPALRGFSGNYGKPRKLGNTVLKGFYKSKNPDYNKLLLHLCNSYKLILDKFFKIPDTTFVSHQEEVIYSTQPLLKGMTFENLLRDKETSVEEKLEKFLLILKSGLHFLANTGDYVGID